MKKFLALLLALTMVFALAACGQPKPAETPAETPAEQPAEQPAEAPVEEPAEATEVTVMSHADFVAAAVEDPVVVETYVQATESWWDNKISVHAQSPDGAYYLYEMACSEEDAAKLLPGTKILVTGFKGEWDGEVEIVDCSFEFVEGDSFLAEPQDIGALVGTEELSEHMNELFTLKGATVLDKGDGAAFFYNWDNSGEDGKCDLYFDVDVNGQTVTLVARRYLTPPGSEVYENVKALQVGDKLDVVGFLYWYNGAQPHITAITPAA